MVTASCETVTIDEGVRNLPNARCFPTSSGIELSKISEAMTFHVHKKSNPSHTSVHGVSHTRVPPSRTLHDLPPLTRILRFLLGEVPRLGMDRAKSRGFVALIFLLSRDSFDGNTAIFLVSEGPRDYPRLTLEYYFPPWTHLNLPRNKHCYRR